MAEVVTVTVTVGLENGRSSKLTVVKSAATQAAETLGKNCSSVSFHSLQTCSTTFLRKIADHRKYNSFCLFFYYH